MQSTLEIILPRVARSRSKCCHESFIRVTNVSAFPTTPSRFKLKFATAVHSFERDSSSTTLWCSCWTLWLKDIVSFAVSSWLDRASWSKEFNCWIRAFSSLDTNPRKSLMGLWSVSQRWSWRLCTAKRSSHWMACWDKLLNSSNRQELQSIRTGLLELSFADIIIEHTLEHSLIQKDACSTCKVLLCVS